jgi:hypothetical protein
MLCIHLEDLQPHPLSSKRTFRDLLSLLTLAAAVILISCLFSIVAVHGLGGDAFETWTHPKSKAFWLKDFLPEQIPDARILTFGYNAAAAFGRSTSDVIDHAKSLLSRLVDKRDKPEVHASDCEE